MTRWRCRVCLPWKSGGVPDAPWPRGFRRLACSSGRGFPVILPSFRFLPPQRPSSPWAVPKVKYFIQVFSDAAWVLPRSRSSSSSPRVRFLSTTNVSAAWRFFTRHRSSSKLTSRRYCTPFPPAHQCRWILSSTNPSSSSGPASGSSRRAQPRC